MKVPALIILAALIMLAASSVFAIDNNSTVMQRMNLMPLAFTQNNGQWPDSVLYRARVHGATMWFTDGGVYYQFTRRVPDSDKTAVGVSGHSPDFDDRLDCEKDSFETMMIKASFVGANPNPSMRSEGLMEYKCNYFLGNDSTKWRTDVSNYQAIVFEEIYAGIDLKYYGDGRTMEYDFIISPGADLSQICIKYDGAKSLAVNDAGELVVETDWGTVTELAPIVYQMDNGERRPLRGAYQLESDDMFSFRLSDEYNPELAVVIDPALVYSTYLGGSDNESGQDIAVDSSGCVYVTGITASSDFPVEDPYQTYQGNGMYDVFVTKLNSSGNGLVYSTYLGSGNHDFGQSIAVDNSGCAYITGYTGGTSFPTQNPYQTCQGVPDAFVTKLNSAGNGLVYSTYLGGNSDDYGQGIAIDGSGCAYVTGFTLSSDFPTKDPYQTYQSDGLYNIFVTKLNSTGSTLVYSTYLGGSSDERGQSIALDGSGCAYLTGYTSSSDFPTQNPYDNSLAGATDAFVVKFSTSGSALVYSTYLGGGGDDNGYGIAIDNAECTYVTGVTSSNDFPTQNPYDDSFNGVTYDAFVTKLSTLGSALEYSTYLGGGGYDEGHDIAVDAAGRAYLTGPTFSSDFPIRSPYNSNLSGSQDAFVTMFSAPGSTLVYSTYLGGGDAEEGLGIAIDDAGCAYLTGWTRSSDFPTKDPHQTYQVKDDAFVTKLDNPTHVSSLADSGPGSLREAIEVARTNEATDTITFAVSGTINLQTPLPPFDGNGGTIVDQGVVILGATAPGGAHSVILDGSALSTGDGLVINSNIGVGGCGSSRIDGLTIRNFPGNGITLIEYPIPVWHTMTNNLIYGNGGLAIDWGNDGVDVNDWPDVADPYNHPEVDSIRMNPDSSFTVYGRCTDSAARIDFYVAHPAGDRTRPADPSGYGEAYSYIGADTSAADKTFVYVINKSVGFFTEVTATATLRYDTPWVTSEFSHNIPLIPSPLIIVAYSPVNIIVTDPDDLQFGRDSLNNDITGIPDGHYFITPNDSVVIDHPKLGEYIIQFVTEAGTPPGAMYSAIIKIDGTDQVAIAADEYAPISGTMATFTYDVEEGYHYINADANRDSTINVGDAVFIINYVFKDGPAPYPLEAADANCDHVINVGDAVHIINYIFKGGPEPCFFEH